MNKNELINKLENIVKRNVKHYVSDFYKYDIEYINKSKQDIYIFLTRECGTYIFNKYDIEENYKVISSILNYYIENEKSHKFYLIKDSKIKKINDFKQQYEALGMIKAL